MATVNASQILSSRASRAYCGGSSADSEPRTFQNRTIPCSKAQASTFHGLRSANRVDELRTRAAAKAKQVTRKVSRNATRISASSDCCGSGMNIVVVSAECAPWSKTGGLGDVVGGLPPALASRCNRVMTVCPRYDQYKDGWDTSVLAELKVGNNLYTVRFFHCYKRGVDRVFIDHPIFLEKVWGETKGKLYGPIAGEDYLDNQLRFAILSMAALEAPRILNLESGSNSGPYGEDVVFVCNDWHTALLPCYLKSMYKAHGIYKNAKVAFCIHNMAYQGRFGFSDFQYLGLPDSFKPSFDFMDGYNKPVKGRKINWMKAALLNSDIALTVSPYYALELVANEATGVELDDVCRKVGLKGIINGMDTTEWNPATDKYIPVKYEASTVKEAKAIIKEALQAEVGLPIDPSVPLIGFIGRLEEQKGSDILVEAIPEMTEENVQIVALGTGKKSFEKQLQQLEERFPDKARGVAKFNVPLAHLIIAGADYILIPSRFEPCGLIQLQAMRYGTLPICSSTGGLVNTVIEGVTGFHMGAFHIDCESVDPQDVAAVVANSKRAIAEYGTPTYDEMVQNCMALDLSWKGPARIWEETLLGLGVPGSEPGIEAEEVAPLAKENVAVP